MTIIPIEDYIDSDVAADAVRSPAFVVTDERQAAWALRKYGEAQEVIARHTAERNRVVERADEWLIDVTAGPRETLEFFEALLTEYHRSRLLDEEQRGVPDKKRSKTIKLRTGRLVARKKPDRVDVTDEGEFVAWALEHDLSMVKVSPLKSEAKRKATVVHGNVMLVVGGIAAAMLGGPSPVPVEEWVDDATGEIVREVPDGFLAVPDEGGHTVLPGIVVVAGDIGYSVQPDDDVVDAEIVEQDELMEFGEA